MGMYTGLRGTIVFKDSLKQQIKGYLQNREVYDTWAEALPSFTHLFLQDSRQTFIPYGDICYLDWDYENEYDEESNTLQFSCSLKNYNSTIGKFIDFLPQIADKWNLESLYEECEPSESTHYSNKE